MRPRPPSRPLAQRHPPPIQPPRVTAVPDIPVPKLNSIFAQIALWLTAATFFLPKINLYEISGSRAGLRVDDFLLLGAAVCFAVAVFLEGARIWQSMLVRWFYFFIGATFLSGLFGGQLNPLFPLRLVEYSVFLFVAYWVASRQMVTRLLLIFLSINVALAVLQAGELVGGFTISGYEEAFEGRVVGLTNGPWELSLVGVLLLSFFLYARGAPITIGKGAAVIGAIGLMIFLSSSRTPLVIMLLVACIYLSDVLAQRAGISRKVFWPAAGFAGVLAMWAVLASDTYLGERTREFFNADNLAYFWSSVTRIHTGPVAWDISRDDALVRSYGMDASMSQRLYILKILVSVYMGAGVVGWTVGVGFGGFGPSTDLGWVRLLVETGLLGATLYTIWQLKCARVSKAAGLMVLCIACNMFTLDAFLSYKGMSVFLFILGMLAAEKDFLDKIHPGVSRPPSAPLPRR
jgi:hypothetical protein